MKVFEQKESHRWFERASRVVAGSPFCPAGGMYGHYSVSVSARGNPIYFSRARGARFWDVDGNEYVDYVCAYGPMVLGYGHPKVDEAARRQLDKGNTVSLAPAVMVELAERLVEYVTVADWAFFAKNGADATNLAVMVARAATGRKKVVRFRGGYHGSSPWMQDAGSGGVLDDDLAHVLLATWNDFEGLEKIVEENEGQVAAVISSPYHHPVIVDNELPAEGFWRRVENLCSRKGIVLILDDVRAGFRLHKSGSNEYFGFRPDLICFGKAMANGYPISALVGTDALREAVASVFFTGTQFFNAAPMAAAVATLDEIWKTDAPARILEIGARVTDGLVRIARGHGYDLRVTGVPSMPFLRIADEEAPVLTEGVSALHKGLHADWISECVQRGAYFLSYHNNFVSAAHTDEDIQRTWDIAEDAFRALRKR